MVVLLALVLSAGSVTRLAAAESIPNEMKVVRTFGGEEVKDPFSLMGSCANRRMAYRLMQGLERNQYPDRIVRPYDLSLQSEWLFGCALNFFQREKYTQEDQGIWLNWRFAMNAGAPKFQFSGRSRSSGERFLCTPPKGVAEDIFTVNAQWNKELGARWRTLQNKLLQEILTKDYPGKKLAELTGAEKLALTKKLNEQMSTEWPKQLLTEAEKKLDEESTRLGEELERVLERPEDGDYEYRVLEKGVSVPVLVKDGKLNYDGGEIELKGRSLGLTETMLFRMLQIASGLWTDGKFHANDATVETGWNDPKVKEFLTGGLKIPDARIRMGSGGNLTVEKNLKLADAWFRVTAISTGKSLLFRATEQMLSAKYFELRGKGVSTEGEETRLAGIAQSSPFLGGFEVRDWTQVKDLNDVLYGDGLVFQGPNGNREERKLGDLLKTLKQAPAVSSDAIFNFASSFRAAQIVSQAWQDGVFKTSDVAVTASPALRGTNPGEFWTDLGVTDVKVNAGTGDERLTITIQIKSKGETYIIRETEDLGRRDYGNLKSYADRIRPIAEKERSSAGTSLHETAGSRVTAKSGTIQAQHADTGWKGALHITEESMEALEESLTAIPSVGHVLVTKASNPDTPAPEDPKPDTPKPQNPKPDVPGPQTPGPSNPVPDTRQQVQELGNFLKSPQNWTMTETQEGNITKVSFSTRFETSLNLKDIRLVTQGFRQGSVTAEIVSGNEASRAASAVAPKADPARTYTLKASGEFNTADRDKAAVTGIRYTTSDDSTEREIPLPSSGIPLSEMKKASPKEEKKNGSSGGCDSGLFTFFTLAALAPAATRAGRKRR